MEFQVREGLVMRTREAADAAEVFAVIDANRAYLREWLPWVDGTESPEGIAGVIESWNKQAEKGTDFVFGIVEDGKYVGNIGLHDIKRHNDSGMIGYWLAENAQGRGIMTACVRTLTDFSFRGLGLNRIYIHAAAPNAKSRAIPERLGFTHEGTMQDGEKLYGTYFDMTLYSMLRRNWVKDEANIFRRTAWLYDLENRDNATDDIPFYKEYAENLGGNVLELACGTGRVAMTLAADGHTVTGLDLSHEMLAEFRKKLAGAGGAEHVRLVYGNMADFRFDEKFAMITTPFRAFQALTEDADIRSCLRLVREHLSENGRFIINVFRPYGQLDQSWLYPDTMRWESTDEAGQHVARFDRGDKIDENKQVIDVHYTYTITRGDGAVEQVEDDLHLKYYYEEQLREMLEEEGFVIHEAFGWYDKTPVENNRELIFVCGRG